MRAEHSRTIRVALSGTARGTPINAGEGAAPARHRNDEVKQMNRIVYCSQATTDFSPEELVELLELARHKNEPSGLTGMLLYSSQSFLQMLEGAHAALEQTYARIEADDRHANLRLLMNVDISERLFPDWTMGFEHVDDDRLAEDLEGFTPETDYPLVNPDLITNGVVAQRLLTLYAQNRVG
jgi:hypothetical protein